jgi:hypothetical protein
MKVYSPVHSPASARRTPTCLESTLPISVAVLEVLSTSTPEY